MRFIEVKVPVTRLVTRKAAIHSSYHFEAKDREISEEYQQKRGVLAKIDLLPAKIRVKAPFNEFLPAVRVEMTYLNNFWKGGSITKNLSVLTEGNPKN